jgi:hypothetical protein
MDKPRIRHIAINVQDREKAAAYYKDIFKLEEKERGTNGTIYLSDGFVDIALINTPDLPWGIHHFGFQVTSVKAIEESCGTTANANVYGAIAESWIQDQRQSGGCLGTWLAGLTEWKRFRQNDQVVTCLRHPKLFPQLAMEAIGCVLILTATKRS